MQNYLKICQEDQVRRNKKIIPNIINWVKEVCGQNFKNRTIAIAIGDNFEDREKVNEIVEQELNPKEIILLNINPPIFSHSWLGFIKVTCFK
jgi:fatty acid-binding protein DegV